MKIKHKLEVVFVGAGRIFQKHYNAVKQLGLDNAVVVAVTDIDRSKLNFADRALKSISTKNIDEIIASKIGNLAVVITESGNHFEPAKKLLLAGYDVLVEKPITLKLEEAYDLINTARKFNRKLYVVKQNRFNKAVQSTKQAVDSGKLGQLNIGTTRVRWCRTQEYYDLAAWRGTWSLDGGVISNQASHHLDILCYFMGEVESVFAYEAKFSANIEAEDTIVAVVKFKSGALGTIEATTSVRPKNVEGSLSLIGSNGMIEIAGYALNQIVQWQIPNEVTDKGVRSDVKIDTSDVYGDGHKSIYNEILSDQRGLPNTAPLGIDGLKSLHLTHMLYKSVEEGRLIYAEELGTGSKRLGHDKI